MKPSTLLLTALVTACLVPSAAAADSVLGNWKTPIGAIVEAFPCTPAGGGGGRGGATVCLRIRKLAPSAPATTDLHNPDTALRSRSLCNLTIGSGFLASDPAHLSGGHLYDPISGHTYKGTITAAGPDTLKLRGYVGISLFGRTETWRRSAPADTCK